MSLPSAILESMSRRLLSALGGVFVIVFVSEAIVMATIGRLPSMSFWTEVLLDAGLTSILVLPACYLFVLRPFDQFAWAAHAASRALREKDDDLRQAVQKFRSIVENAVEGIYQTTPAGELLNGQRGTGPHPWL